MRLECTTATIVSTFCIVMSKLFDLHLRKSKLPNRFLLERLLWPPLATPSANLNGAVMLAWTLPLFLRCFHFADWSFLTITKPLSVLDLDFILIRSTLSLHTTTARQVHFSSREFF